MKKIKFPPMKDIEHVANGGWFSQWCCGCGLRHIWHFNILEGDTTTGGQFIEIRGFQDDKGTELRDFYMKHRGIKKSRKRK